MIITRGAVVVIVIVAGTGHAAKVHAVLGSPDLTALLEGDLAAEASIGTGAGNLTADLAVILDHHQTDVGEVPHREGHTVAQRREVQLLKLQLHAVLVEVPHHRNSAKLQRRMRSLNNRIFLARAACTYTVI